MDDDDDALSPSPSPTSAAVSVAVAPSDPPSLPALTLALPIPPRPSSAPNPPSSAAAPNANAGNGRDDAWSEGATSTLIDAWGERYIELSRGSLKQKHWQEVADAVTSRHGYTKTPKTDVQCKNRIDTLKKKYKTERAKISSGSASASAWPFYPRLDRLLGPTIKPAGAAAGAAKQPSQPPRAKKIPAGVPIRAPLITQFPQRHRSSHPAFRKIKSSPPSVASSKSGGLSGDSSDGLPPLANGKRPRDEGEEERRGFGLKELTQAIIRFGDVYERVESSKLQHNLELEKQRLGFARELELQRMQFFVKTQMELSQLKRGGGGNGEGNADGYQHNSGVRKRRMSGEHHDNGSNNSNQ